MNCPFSSAPIGPHCEPALGLAAADQAHMDFSQAMAYGDYLHLGSILGAQHPLSPAHDEMLFIVQHQTSELWMKLMLHELAAAIQCIESDRLSMAFKMMARVSTIMAQLVHAWDVLATMTPPEYTAIRPYLAASSGFQSHQYRCSLLRLSSSTATQVGMGRGDVELLKKITRHVFIVMLPGMH